MVCRESSQSTNSLTVKTPMPTTTPSSLNNPTTIMPITVPCSQASTSHTTEAVTSQSSARVSSIKAEDNNECNTKMENPVTTTTTTSTSVHHNDDNNNSNTIEPMSTISLWQNAENIPVSVITRMPTSTISSANQTENIINEGPQILQSNCPTQLSIAVSEPILNFILTTHQPTNSSVLSSLDVSQLTASYNSEDALSPNSSSRYLNTTHDEQSVGISLRFSEAVSYGDDEEDEEEEEEIVEEDEEDDGGEVEEEEIGEEDDDDDDVDVDSNYADEEVIAQNTIGDDDYVGDGRGGGGGVEDNNLTHQNSLPKFRLFSESSDAENSLIGDFSDGEQQQHNRQRDEIHDYDIISQTTSEILSDHDSLRSSIDYNLVLLHQHLRQSKFSDKATNPVNTTDSVRTCENSNNNNYNYNRQLITSNVQQTNYENNFNNVDNILDSEAGGDLSCDYEYHSTRNAIEELLKLPDPRPSSSTSRVNEIMLNRNTTSSNSFSSSSNSNNNNNKHKSSQISRHPLWFKLSSSSNTANPMNNKSRLQMMNQASTSRSNQNSSFIEERFKQLKSLSESHEPTQPSNYQSGLNSDSRWGRRITRGSNACR
ncbi:unnamed protein product [Trichobilharzia regenti]|nr:unnamed protein product [Trichobilharzia regenti]